MKRIWAILALGIILALAPAFADQTPTGASTQAGSAETATTTSATSQSISAGQVMEVNLDVTRLSQYWAGFYGQITESIVLGSGSTIFYEWPISAPSGYVYITNSTGTDFSTLDGGVTDTDIVSAGIWSAAPSAPEDVATTFPQASDTDETTYCGADYTTNPGLTFTKGDFDGDGTPGDEWPTCLLKDGSGNIVFKAQISTAASRAGFKGAKVDYQALVAAGSGTTYYFYKG